MTTTGGGSGDEAVVVVLCTVPDGQQDRLVESLLHERLIACANVSGPVQSRYRWQGALESAVERLLVLKTTRARLAELRERLVALHPYLVPELLELPVAGGLPAYLQWVADSVRG